MSVSPPSVSPPAIHLGFAEAVSCDDAVADGAAAPGDGLNGRWFSWDGGKLGGRPYWLVPGCLPPLSALVCKHCGARLVLLAQVSAPVAVAAVGHEGAYHRMLYVFCCAARAACVNRPGDAAAPGGPAVVVLRGQLGARSCLYDDDDGARGGGVGGGGARAEGAPLSSAAREGGSAAGGSEGGGGDGDDNEVRPAGWSAASVACALCGLPAPHRCSRCRARRYCCREHQTLHWSLGGGGGHKAECAALSLEAASAAAAAGGGAHSSPQHQRAPSSAALAAVRAAALQAGAILPEFELFIDEEPSPAERQRLQWESLPKGLRTAADEAHEAKAAAFLLSAAAAVPGARASDFAPPATAGAADDESLLTLDGLSQRKLAEITGARLCADVYTSYFHRRIACDRAQVVRYCLWPPEALSAADPLKDAFSKAQLLDGKVSSGVAVEGKAPSVLAAPATAAVGGSGEAAGAPALAQSGVTAPLMDGGGVASALSAATPSSFLAAGAVAAEDASAGGKASAADGNGDGNGKEGEEEEDDDDEDDEVEPFGAPLWVSGRHPLPLSAATTPLPPPCRRCGAPRRFEFQITPQTLSYVLGATAAPSSHAPAPLASASSPASSSFPDIDFGTIAVYTCTASCDVLSAAQERSALAAAREGRDARLEEDASLPLSAVPAGGALPPATKAADGASLAPLLCGYAEEFAWVQPADEEGVSLLELARQAAEKEGASEGASK